MAANRDEGQIDRLLAFINSRGVGFDTSDLLAGDRLDEDGRKQLGYPLCAPPSASGMDELRELRSIMLALVRQEKGALDALNAISARHHFVYQFVDGRGAIAQPVDTSIAAQLIGDAARLPEVNGWDRMKLCADPKCGASFFDTTRARTRRWCSVATCGNKANVAAFRSRTAAPE